MGESNESFAKRMADRRTKRKFPELPDDVVPCGPCDGAGVTSGEHCTRCSGYGFLRKDGSIAEVHSARGGFYRWGPFDAVVETMVNLKTAYAGAASFRDGYFRNGARVSCGMGQGVADTLRSAESQRWRMRTEAGRLELWLLPTPAPDRCRLTVYNMNEAEGLFAVTLDSELACLYRVGQHLQDMLDPNKTFRDRLEGFLTGRYLSHPGDDAHSTATPIARTIRGKLLPVALGEKIRDDAWPVSAEGIRKFKLQESRIVGAVRVCCELQREPFADPIFEAVTL